MNEREEGLMQRMVAGVSATPGNAAVLVVRQYSVEETTQRAKRLLNAASDVCNVSMDRSDWVQQANRTLVRLPLGGRAVIYHASGAMKVSTGLEPMEALFGNEEPVERLTSLVQELAERLRVSEWMGQRDSLRFERLWQIKACAADRERRQVKPVLCRVVGAYRQYVEDLPVLGAASVAVKAAAGGALDSVSVQLRETTGEVIDWVPVMPPEEAAKQILIQLDSLMGKSKTPFEELVRSESMQFGYISLGKRSNQMYLAPHYVASVEIEGEEAQAYQFVVPATERVYMPFCQAGVSSVPVLERRNG